MKTIERRAVAGACPEADALIHEARQRQRKRRWLAALTVGAVVAVVATIVGVGGGRPVHRSRADDHPAPSGAATQTLRIEWRAKVPAGVASMTLADGSLWVAGFGAVTRLDPLSGRIIARIRTPRANYVPEVTGFEGRVWVSSGGYGPSSGTLDEIDPSSNRVARTFRVPGPPSGMTGGAGYLWTDVGNSLRPFDPRAGRFLPAVVNSFQGVSEPAYGLGSAWAVSDNSLVWRIDPKSRRASQFWPSSSSRVQPRSGISQPDQVSIADGSVWIVFGNEVGRFDPATGRLESTLTVTKTEGVVLQGAGNSVWALMETGSSDPYYYYPDPRQPGRVARLDPGSGAFAGSPAAIGSSAGYDSFVANGTMAWVGDRYNSVVIAIAPVKPG